MRKNICVLLEFGIPPYRDFLFEYLRTISNRFLVIHNGEIFDHKPTSYESFKCHSFDLLKFKFYSGISGQLGKFDVVISSFNFWRPSCWLPLFSNDNKRKIIWGHIQGSHENIISRTFKKVCIKRADYVLSYTEKGKRYAVDHLGADPDKVLVVRNTIAVSNATKSTKERSYFLYVGRIQKRKNLSTFIESLKHVQGDGELFKIVGDGEHKRELIDLVEKLDLTDKVKFFPGTFDDGLLKSYFEHAIAYVSPSQLGLGVVHSFAYGIPVLADRSENHGPEFGYCDDKNSFLYNGNKEILPLIENILSNKMTSFEKGEEAFDFFNSNLSVQNMQDTFYKAIYE